MLLKKILISSINKSITITTLRCMGRFHEDHKKGGYHGEDPTRHNINTLKKVCMCT